VIRLEPLRGHERCCSRCGRLTPAIHDLEERRIRDPPLFERWVEPRVLQVRVECPTCGPKLERLAWLAAYARVTHRLTSAVARLCRVMALRQVARYFGLDCKTAKEIDGTGLLRKLGPIDVDGVEVIALGEFAIHKGHRYVTMIVEPSRKRVLWIGRGRGPQGCPPVLQAARC
jgi:transposase